MKKTVILAALATLIVAGSVAADGAGSAFGCLTTARSQGMGRGSFTGGVGIANATSVAGMFNYGLSESTDGRVKLGFIDGKGNDDIEWTFGLDFNVQVWDVKSTAANSIDLAIGGLFEYVGVGDASILQLGGQVLGSYPFVMTNGTTLSPYGRVNLRMERLSYSGLDSESDLRFGLNAGVGWEISSTFALYGEFQMDGNDGLFLGAEFNIM